MKMFQIFEIFSSWLHFVDKIIILREIFLIKTKYLTYNIKTKAKNITFKRLFLQKGVVNLH